MGMMNSINAFMGQASNAVNYAQSYVTNHNINAQSSFDTSYAMAQQYINAPPTQYINGARDSGNYAVNYVSSPPTQYINGARNSNDNSTASFTNELQNSINGLQSHIDAATQANLAQFQNIIGQFQNQAQGIYQSVIAPITNAIPGLNNAIQIGISQIDSQINNAIGSNILPTLNASTSVVQQIGSAIQQIASSQQQQTSQISSDFNSAFKSIGQQFIDAANVIKESQASKEAVGGVQYQNISNAITGPFSDVINAVINEIGAWWTRFKDDLNGRFNTGGKWLNDRWTYSSNEVDKSFDHIKNIYKSIINEQYSTIDDLLKDINLNRDNKTTVSKLLSLYEIITFTQSLDQTYNNAVNQKASHLINKEVLPNLPNVGQLLTLLIRDNPLHDYYMGLLHSLGYSDDIITSMLVATLPLFNHNELEELYIRGFINEQQLDKSLSNLGYDDNQISLLKSTYLKNVDLASYADFARKGIFDQNYINYMNLNYNIPDDIVDIGKWNGLTEFASKNIYYSGWQNPNVSMLLDMYHRGIIDENTLDMSINYSALTPYFKDKVKQQSFSILSRRDVTNLVKAGMINEQQVIDAYKAMGYEQTKAELLSSFTIRYGEQYDPNTLTKVKEATQGTIEAAFKRNIIDEPTTIERLIALGYHQDDAQLLVSVWAYNTHVDNKKPKELEHKNKAVNMVISAYSKGAIPYNDAHQYLLVLGYDEPTAQQELMYAELEQFINHKETLLGKVKNAYINNAIDSDKVYSVLESNQFTQDEIGIIVSEADLEKGFRNKNLSLAELEQMFKKSIITTDDLILELQGLGYHDKYIGWILAKLGVLQ